MPISKIIESLKFVAKTFAIGSLIAIFCFAAFPELRQNNTLWLSLFGDYSNTHKPVSYAKAVSLSAPSVVNIYSEGIETSQRFVNSSSRKVQRLGSGVIASDKGFILTAAHVVKNAELINVALQDGRVFEAQLIGVDLATDLAVLYVEANNLPAINISQSHPIQAGDLVLAIGNPYNLGQTITQGIISATGRSGLTSGPGNNVDYSDFIQMDAAINEGNSGGALVNSNGELVGINSAKLGSRLRNRAQGIFFAVHVHQALTIMKKIITDGRVVRGYLGIQGEHIQLRGDTNSTSKTIGILVTEVTAESPAYRHGLEPADIIIEMQGNPISNARDVLTLIEQSKPGTSVELTILRNKKRLHKQVIISELPTQ